MDKTYAELLKDPRWQKKRLEILQRDNWCCQKCYGTESTLFVHHKRYTPDVLPWDYPDRLLITLCEECHEYERTAMKAAQVSILEELQEKFLSQDILNLAYAINQMDLFHTPEIVADTFAWALTDPFIQRELISRYFEHLKKLALERNGILNAKR